MRVLLAIDGSAASLQAARLIAGYRSDRSRAVPVLLNVQPPPLRAWPGAGLDQTVVEAALREQGARELETVRSILAQTGFAAKTVVRVGYPPDAIMDEARQRNVGAIVMGTRGRGAVDGFAFGSVALRVAHGSEFPVVLVKPDARLPAELGRRARVVVPVDGSHEATRAAVRLAQWRDWLGELRVDVVHFQRPLTVLEAVMPPHGDALAHWSGLEAQEAVAGARDALAGAGIGHEVHVLAGEPATGIARFAQEHSADFVAMSTRGLGALHHAFLGSVALKVAHLSSIPVAFLR